MSCVYSIRFCHVCDAELKRTPVEDDSVADTEDIACPGCGAMNLGDRDITNMTGEELLAELNHA